ncbi:hypothetical protein R5D33_001767 [Salmonella enterica]|nr:hypothetical protein [Salmonella enterica]
MPVGGHVLRLLMNGHLVARRADAPLTTDNLPASRQVCRQRHRWQQSSNQPRQQRDRG